ncbi:aldehyde dehydrogenase family protein, partial [Mycobacterium ulcerans str. Harvey]
FYMQPTIFSGTNKMRIFQEEIFGPVVAVTPFTDYDDAMGIANDTLYGWGRGCGAATATRPTGRPGHPAGRVWVNCYHVYPAHSAFGGTSSPASGGKASEDAGHYQQTKNLLVSYSDKALGLF